MRPILISLATHHETRWRGRADSDLDAVAVSRHLVAESERRRAQGVFGHSHVMFAAPRVHELRGRWAPWGSNPQPTD